MLEKNREGMGENIDMAERGGCAKCVMGFCYIGTCEEREGMEKNH